MTATATRDLPHSLEADRSVLGAILINSGILDVVADRLTPADFYRDAHRRVFRRMLDLHEQQAPIDLLTLREALARSDDLDAVGGPAYIASLADGVPRSTNAEYYAGLVREKARARAVIVAANALLDDAYAEDDSAALIDRAERTLLDLSAQAVPGDLVPAAEIARAIYPEIERLQDARQPVTGVATGFTDLDRATRGLQRGSLVILAGRPSSGKSSLALQIAAHVAKETPVACFSVEMSQREQMFRVLSILGRVDGHRLQCGQLSDDDQRRVGRALTDFEQRRFWLDDSGTLTPLQIRSRARRLKARYGLGLVIVDYLQLLNHPKAESREQAVAATARTLKQVARELDVPLLALCQLSREVDKRENKRPQLSDLRESGALEQDADVALLIHRPTETSNGVVSVTPPVELIVAKSRNGPTATIDLAWLGEQFRFGEVGTREEHR